MKYDWVRDYRLPNSVRIAIYPDGRAHVCPSGTHPVDFGGHKESLDNREMAVEYALSVLLVGGNY